MGGRTTTGLPRAPTRLVTAGLLVTAIFFAFLVHAGWLPTSYLKAWGTETVFFDKFKIDSATKFAYAAAFVFLNTVINAYVDTIYGSWKVAVVNDPKTLRCDMLDTTDSRVHLTVQVYGVYAYLSNATSVFFMFSNIWFVVVQTIAGGLVSYYTCRKFLRRKLDSVEYEAGLCRAHASEAHPGVLPPGAATRGGKNMHADVDHYAGGSRRRGPVGWAIDGSECGGLVRGVGETEGGVRSQTIKL